MNTGDGIVSYGEHAALESQASNATMEGLVARALHLAGC